MKRTILFLVMILSLTTIFSCSSDDDNSTNLNENAQKLIGTWGRYAWGGELHKQFTFRSDSKVEYYTYPNGQPILEEVGDWSMDGDILTMTFPETVVIVYVQKVIFINDSKVQFVQVEGSNEEPYDGTYYKVDIKL